MTARRRKGDKCRGWCDLRESGPHNGRCVVFIGEVLLSSPGDSYALSVTAEGHGKHPEPYVAVAGRGSVSYALAHLTWDEADQLADLLSSARRRFA